MLLAERGLLDRVEILGTDLSTAAIARAKQGRHTRRALRLDPPPELVERYLDRAATGVTVTPRIHRAVEFRTLNLLDDAAVAALGTFDVILSRNVLIYFSDELVVRIVDRIARALAPNGVIPVGVVSAVARTVLARLRRAGDLVVIATARDGSDALAKIDELDPDVVTLDLTMPTIDGIGVLRALQGRQRPRVIVVRMSSIETEF